MPRSTKSGGVYIEISGNIEPFKKQLELAQELAKKTSRNLQNATEGFFNEHQIKKITDSLSRNLLNVRATAISCQKDISLFGRHFEQIAQKIGLAGEQAKIFGKDIENALKNAKEKSLERSMRSLQQQIGLTDQAYMRLASSMGATEAAMKKAESVLNVRTYSQIKDEIKRVAEAYNQFVKSGKAAPNDIKRAHDAATKAIRQLGVELRSTTNEFRKEEKAAKSLLDRIGKSTLIFAGGFLTTHAIVQSLKDIVTGSIEASTALNRLELAYSSIYQGASNGKVQLQYIYEQAIKTGQEYVSLAESAKTFFAAGQNSTIKNEMNDIFESVNLAGAALQLNATQMQRVYYAIGQMISKGKVSAEEMRQQLGEQLPGAFQIAAKAMGVTTAELDKMMADGKLMTEDFLPKFSKAIREQYGEAGLKASDTLQGAINRVKTEFELLKASFVDSESMTQVIKGVASGFTALKHFVESGTLGAIAKGLGAAGVAAIALNPRIAALGTSFVTALNTSALATKGFTAALTGMFTVLRAHPIMAVITAIGALTTAYSLLTEETDKAKESQEKLNKSQEAYIVVEKVLNNTSSTLHEYSESITIAEQNIKSLNEQTLNIPPTLEALSNSLYDAEGNVTSLEREFQELIRSYRQTNDIEKFNDELRIFAQKAKESSSKTDELSKAIETAQKIAKQGIDLHVSLTGFESALSKLKQLFTFGKHGIQFDVSKMSDNEDAAYSKNMQKLVNDTFSHTNEYNNAAINQQITALKEYREYLDTDAGKVGLLDDPEVVKKRIDANIKYFEGKLKGLKENKPKGGGAAKAANAQEDYNALLEKTNAELASIEEKFKYNSAEKVQKKISDITYAYNKELVDIDRNINKMLNSKKVSKAQADELRGQQKLLAERKKNLALQELQEKMREQEMQHLQTQIGFYNELAELSGQYDVSAQLRMQLIDLEAEKFSKIANIPSELVEKWKEFKKLQASTDPFDGAYRGLKKFTAEYGDSAKQWESLSYNFAKGFEQNIHDMFDEFIDTGKISFDNMAQLFKNLLKQMAYQALVQPIVLSVVNGIAGAVYGGTTAANGAASGVAGIGGNGLTQMAGGMAQSYAMGKIGGSILDGVGNWFNSAAASLFPETFAATASQVAGIQASAASAGVSNLAAQQALQEVAMSGAAAPGVSNVAMNSGIAAASHMPTQTATQMLSSGWTMGAGLAGSLLGNYVLVPALGIKGGLGTSIGSTAGGALGGLGGAIAGATLIGGSFGGPIGAGLGALAGTVLGALGGSLFGGGYEDEPGYYINTYTDLTKKEGLAGYKEGTAIQNHRWDSFSDSTASSMRDKVARPLMTQLRENTVALHEQIVALGGEDLGESFFAAVRKHQGSGDKRTGKGGIELSDYFHVHGEWHETNSPDVEKWAEQIGEQYQKVIIKSIANMDMKPITIAADGMVADTEEEIAIALAKAGSLISVGDAIEDEKLKKSFEEGISKSLVAALKDIDTSDLGLNIDKSSLAGWQTAIQAMAAWQEVNNTIKETLEPTSEITAKIKELGQTFATWEANLTALGWSAEKVEEIDEKRVEVFKHYADEIMKGLEPQNKYIDGLKNINDQMTDLFEGLKDQNLDNDYLVSVLSKRNQYIRNSIDESLAEFEGSSDAVSEHLDSLNEAYDSIVQFLEDIGYEADYINQIRVRQAAATDSYIQSLLDEYEDSSQIYSDIEGINNSFRSIIRSMKEHNYTDAQIRTVELKRLEKIKNYTKSITDQWLRTEDALTTSLNEINTSFDDLVRALKDVGASSKEVAGVERQRSQALQQTAMNALRSYDQDLNLRIMALQHGSDSTQYAIKQLQYQQENELKETREAIGRNTLEYQTMQLVQQAEMVQLKISLLENQLKEALQEQIDAVNEELSSAQSLKSTFDSIYRTLKKARSDLWVSENNLLGTRYQESYKRFNETYLKAINGDTDALNELPSLGNTVLQLAREQVASRGEYDTAFYDVDKKLKTATEYAQKQVSESERTIALLQSQLDSLNAQTNAITDGAGQISMSIEAMQAELASLTSELASILGQITAMPEQQSATLSQRELLLQAKSDALNAEAYYGRTDWTPESTLAEIYAKGLSLESWYMKYGRNEGLGVDYDAVGATIAQMSDYQQSLINNKTSMMNAGHTLGKGQVAGDWTTNSVISEILSKGMTIDQWYDRFGKNEGIVADAIETANRVSTNAATKNASNIIANASANTKAYMQLLSDKANAMNNGISLAVGQQAGGWTAESVYTAITNAGLTVKEWYEQFGRNEGFTMAAAATTNEQIKQTEAELAAAFKSISVNVSVSGGGSSSSYVSSSYSSPATSSTSSSSTSSAQSATSTATKSISSKYSSDYALLVQKATDMNNGKNLGKGQTAGGWTAGKVLDEIENKGMSFETWYNRWGKNEGYASGGITPRNEAFWVGEKGPELMMSPHSYGVLNNRDSIDLMRSMYNTSGDYAMGSDKEAVEESNNILRQILRKLDTQAYDIKKLKNNIQKWDIDGMPAVATA